MILQLNKWKSSNTECSNSDRITYTPALRQVISRQRSTPTIHRHWLYRLFPTVILTSGYFTPCARKATRTNTCSRQWIAYTAVETTKTIRYWRTNVLYSRLRVTECLPKPVLVFVEHRSEMPPSGQIHPNVESMMIQTPTSPQNECSQTAIRRRARQAEWMRFPKWTIVWLETVNVNRGDIVLILFAIGLISAGDVGIWAVGTGTDLRHVGYFRVKTTTTEVSTVQGTF